MCLGLAHDLSISDLLRLLNQKLGLECTKLRQVSLPPARSVASLESEIESLKARAHDVLKLIPSLRNVLRPANRLPPEILSCIVQNVSEDANDAATIIPLTRVCRYWRESIISTPTNWTSISSRSRSIAALSLKRAGAAPLNINIRTSQIGEGHWFPDLLVHSIQCTRTLNVNTPSVTELKRVLPDFPQSMPNLRSLALSADPPPPWDRLLDPFESFVPALRSLSLTDIPLYPSFLQLRTLVELDLCDPMFDLHLDTLLDFLEENHLLTRAIIAIRFTEPSLRSSRRRAAIGNRLQYLRIVCHDAADGRALISNIALSKGAELSLCGRFGGAITVNDVLSNVSTTHLSNIQSPTWMEYCADSARGVRLSGPNGTALFGGASNSDTPFVEFPWLPLTSIRHFCLCALESTPSLGSLLFHHLSSFPALEAFTVDHGVDLSHLSVLLSNPSASPCLKTLGFLGCILTEEFMEKLTRFASDRKNTSSAWLHRVVIVHREGRFPSIASIRKLEGRVPVVDVRIAELLPADLTIEAHNGTDQAGMW